MPVHGIPVAKRLYKKELELKQIGNFLGPRSRIKLGHFRYYRHQPLDAKIYPNKFLQSHVEEKNPANVSIFPTRPISCCSDDANLRADVAVEAYEYVDDICAFYKSEEEEKSMCIKPNVIARLKHGIDKKLRACIVEWLIEAHKLFKFPTEALFLAINLFDRFVAICPVEKKKVSLVRITALQLAAKYAGIRESIPCVYLFSHLALTSCPVKKISCSAEQIVEMEYLILNTIEYELSIPTPSTFISNTCPSSSSISA
ncbi:cyclin-B2-1-like isoform X2 [Syzygium oleosum]|uniref:cyclin-B2-1-like isoform X2 n=1 Tax=Syzygium oleosum TaxID=219896 RepID=UPI0024BA6C96|nr:cyclin-B2-1-like isoform X2 [Syzygium oleosum]